MISKPYSQENEQSGLDFPEDLGLKSKEREKRIEERIKEVHQGRTLFTYSLKVYLLSFLEHFPDNPLLNVAWARLLFESGQPDQQKEASKIVNRLTKRGYDTKKLADELLGKNK